MFSAQKSIKLYTMTAIIIFLSFLTAVAIAFLYKRFRWKKNFNREALLLSDQALEESIWRLWENACSDNFPLQLSIKLDVFEQEATRRRYCRY